MNEFAVAFLARNAESVGSPTLFPQTKTQLLRFILAAMATAVSTVFTKSATMIANIRWFSPFTFLLVLLSGCGSVATLEPSTSYVSPSANEGVTGFVKGTQTWGLIGNGPTAFVYAVDGKRVSQGLEKWSELLPIRAGLVDLEIGLQSGPLRRIAHFDVKVSAGELYEIRFQVGGDATAGGKRYCDIWIASLASDTAISPIERVSLMP